jgi:AcrR family transcriptional regulator
VRSVQLSPAWAAGHLWSRAIARVDAMVADRPVTRRRAPSARTSAKAPAQGLAGSPNNTRNKVSSEPPQDLREACVTAAHLVIAEHGIEALSSRDVARRLGVSHQAPYKHYPSRDHLLAEVIRRCFQQFAQALNDRPRTPDPMGAMRGMCKAYLRYALSHPLEYRLMFGTPWPGAADHPDLLRDARLAFDVLREGLAQLHGIRVANERVDRDAMFVWSTMHGLATILQCNAMQHLEMKGGTLEAAPAHVMQMIDTALSAAVK